MASASSSVSFLDARSDVEQQQQQQQQQQAKQQRSSSAATAAAAAQVAAPPKKRRNLSGNLYPDAEVVTLSPKTLLATNRYVCEVCNKGFQREQNLQLHRRGHNLPWKLRQKNPKEVRRRRVYLCPEPTCVHHDPSRALGDLTGVKKHFSRKHGKKKWKCDKCSKMYAVQSDWKAHSKTCGTREYRCECGTLFSRRDSFITHRTFCDAIAQQSSRLPIILQAAALNTNLYGNCSMARSGLSQANSHLISSLLLPDQSEMLRLGGGGGRTACGPAAAQFDQYVMSPHCSNPSAFHAPNELLLSSAFQFGSTGSQQGLDIADHGQPQHSLLINSKPFHGSVQLPDHHHHHHLQINNASSAGSSCAANLFNLSFFSNTSSTAGSSMININARDQNYHLLQLADQFSAANGSLDSSTAADLFSSNYGQIHGSIQSIDHSFLPRTSATANGGGSSMFNGGGFRSSAPVNGVGDDLIKPYMMADQTHLQDLIMNSFVNGSTTSLFGGGGGDASAYCINAVGEQAEKSMGGSLSNFDASLYQAMNETKIIKLISGTAAAADGNLVGGSSDQLTRDFLGVGAIVAPGEHHGAIDRSSVNAEMKSAAASGRPFAGVNMQYMS